MVDDDDLFFEKLTFVYSMSTRSLVFIFMSRKDY